MASKISYSAGVSRALPKANTRGSIYTSWPGGMSAGQDGSGPAFIAAGLGAAPGRGAGRGGIGTRLRAAGVPLVGIGICGGIVLTSKFGLLMISGADMLRILSIVVVLIALTGCATREPAPVVTSPLYEFMISAAADKRLYNVWTTLLAANNDLCARVGRVGRHTGFRANNVFSFPPGEVRDFATRTLKLTERPTVVMVTPTASRAGLVPGDEIIEYENVSVGKGPQAVERLIAAAKAASEAARVSLVVERRGIVRRLQLPRNPICAYDVALSNSDLAAVTDGSGIAISRDVVLFTESNNELAFVLGHELAHILAQHFNRQDVWNFENEADMIGLYLAARAGYDISGTPQLMERVKKHLRPISMNEPPKFFAPHPDMSRRIGQIRATIREIEARRARGEPLIPAQLNP